MAARRQSDFKLVLLGKAGVGQVRRMGGVGGAYPPHPTMTPPPPSHPLPLPPPIRSLQSCLVLRFTRNEFVADNDTTVGAAFLTKTILLDDCDVCVAL